MIIFHRKIHVKMALLSIAKLLQLSEGRQTGSFTQMKLEKQGSNTFFSFFSLSLILFHTRPWKPLAAWWPSQCLLSHLANVTGAAWEAQDCLRMKSTSLSSPNTNAQPLLPHFRHLFLSEDIPPSVWHQRYLLDYRILSNSTETQPGFNP